MAINKDKKTTAVNTATKITASSPSFVPPPIVFMRPTDKNLAIMVSKKYFKTAVARNKAKRLVREAIKTVLAEEKLSISSFFLTISAQKSILDVQFQDIVALIRSEILRQKVRLNKIIQK